MSRIFATRGCERWARKERVADATLLDAVDRADAGLVDGNLRGCLVKLRVARPGEGRRDGYRTILAYRSGHRAFFLYGYPKNVRGRVEDDETEALEEFGAILLGLTELQLAGQIEEGKLREITR